jgi:CheY-like chemotaxis protein
MPKIDGFQLYTKIREQDLKTKICFLTASEMYYEKFRKARSKFDRIIEEGALFKNQSKMKI